MGKGSRQQVDDKEKLERRFKEEAEEKFLENFSPCLQEEEEEKEAGEVEEEEVEEEEEEEEKEEGRMKK